ncbi:MAG: hypothetical protein CVT67_04860 [Actinobacteria bacterium HGW-Actinobacteria-7]|nr:MAG: hypothetical protein CVT67_04860 [Actinobacteria bacterium HGW-Actinobacteria-7]
MSHHVDPEFEHPVLEGVDPLSWDVFRALKRAMHLNRQLLMRTMSDKGGHPAQSGCLWVIASHEGMSQRDLAGFLHLAPATVTTMLQRMEAGGLIERWSDEADQRLTRIGLTDAGRELNKSLGAANANVINATVSALPEDDRRELVRLMNLLADSAATELERLDA